MSAAIKRKPWLHFNGVSLNKKGDRNDFGFPPGIDNNTYSIDIHLNNRSNLNNRSKKLKISKIKQGKI